MSRTTVTAGGTQIRSNKRSVGILGNSKDTKGIAGNKK